MNALAARAQAAEIELVGKGYTEAMARAAVSQALRWSMSIAAKVAPERREAVAWDLFLGRLREVEADYLAGMTRAADEPAVS